jgi:hypothetical protein
MKALQTQAEVRAEGKVKATAAKSLQNELFESMLEMGPDKTAVWLAAELTKATDMVRTMTPRSPDHIVYRKLWATVLSRCAVKKASLNKICAEMKSTGELSFPEWEQGKRVPQDHYRVQRA